MEIDELNMEAVLKKIEAWLMTASNSHLIVTPNSEMIVLAEEDSDLKKILNNADLTVADGVGVLLAARLMGQSLPERVTGIDLTKELLAVVAEKGYSVYFLGAQPGTAQRAKQRLKEKYSQLRVLGTHHGYLDRQSEAQVIEEINSLQPDLLLVGMGTPLQEKWLAKHLPDLQIKVAIGVGGSFDILAGDKKRAPLWVQRLGLEWFYRLCQEPQRLFRLRALPKFVFLVLIKEIL